MNEIIIRPATAQDAELIAAISRETFYDSFSSYNTKTNMDKFMNEQFSYEMLVSEVGSPGNIFLMAYIHGEIAGYAKMRDGKGDSPITGESSIELCRIYVVTKMIRTGVGKSLMEACVDIAIEMKKRTIWLGVWEHNKRAIDFYTRGGFERFGDHLFMLGDDAQTDWLMRKRLM